MAGQSSAIRWVIDMTGVNWNLAAQNTGMNALMQGVQFGQQMANQREQREYRNALMEQRQGQLAFQQQQAQAKAQADAQKQRQEQMGTFRQLLTQAGDNPQQAFAAAQQLGIDLSSIPQPGTPEFEPWRQQQLFILDALDKEGDNLPGLAREVMLALPEDQRDPNGAQFRSAFTAALENKYAAEYVDPQGNTRRRSIMGQQPAAPSILPAEQRPAGKTDDQLFQEAREAVERGANVDTVFRQLQAWGVEVN